MFKNFYSCYVNSEIVLKKDLSTLIEIMADPNYIGVEKLKSKIFPLMGTK